MSPTTDVLIIGAGPHGLSAAMHLRRAGVEPVVVGKPMSFWQTMPRGMKLRSNWSATSIGEPQGALDLDGYQRATGDRFSSPVPLDRFVDYGLWFQEQVAPDVRRTLVQRVDRGPGGFDVELEDGERLSARRVVVACGIDRFAWMPPEFRALPPELATHSGEHTDFSRFEGRRVAVIGGGQSALESAALMQEEGAEVDVFVRRERVIWLKANSPKNLLGPVGPIVYAPTDVGPLWYSRLVSVPDLFRRLPRSAQTRIAYRAIRPACSNWVRIRLDDVHLHLGAEISDVAAHGDGVRLRADGAVRDFDHVLLATGYRVDVARYPFLSPQVVHSLHRVAGYPVLRRGLESSVSGLHFLGAPASYSFGPILRFVSGSWYSGRSVARSIAGRRSVPEVAMT